MTKRAVLYVRQSLDREEGVDRQLARCTEMAERQGWTVVHTYRDNDVSATKPRGPGTAWADMLDGAAAGAFDVVVATDMDRLLRGIRDLLTLIDAGVAVTTIDGEINLATADGQLRATMLAGMARFETARKSERQKRANESRRAQGRPTPGKRRYGYQTDGCTPVEEEAVTVREVFDRVEKGHSLRGIARDLTARGVPSATMKSWTPGRLRDILNRPHYAGQALVEGVLTESKWITPVVTPERAERVRTILADPGRRTTPGPGTKHLMSGLALCDICGTKLFFSRGYLCKADTSHGQIQKKFLDPLVIREVVKGLMFAPGGSVQTGESLATILAELEANHALVSDTYSERDEGLLPPAVARVRLLKFKDDREAIEARIEAQRAAQASSGILGQLRAELWVPGQVDLNKMVEIGARVEERFHGLSLDEQRELVRTLLDVRVAKGRGSERVKIRHLVATSLDEEDWSLVGPEPRTIS
ncbi:recombinase family protein [Rathayibacter sp. VKM Ac-2927]|uniref:recombinase family protein n=1 Tax=Rathayibacter sp. VKM Ac-2927 TaxID=2929478 RepID=UPI001FB4700F|nr:recombinase family protein [Rathayibacter sp. VKM Ac-2927]MCJ1687871.1 recombinase family protein [Rathayibacter sp. VKM Ac-2927]